MKRPDFNPDNNPFVQRAKVVLRSRKHMADASGAKLISELEDELEMYWRRTAVETAWQEHWQKFKLHGLEAADVFEIKAFLHEYFEGKDTRIEVREADRAVAVSVDMKTYHLETRVIVVPMKPKKPRRLDNSENIPTNSPERI
jgi:hypothetical protein